MTKLRLSVVAILVMAAACGSSNKPAAKSSESVSNAAPASGSASAATGVAADLNMVCTEATAAADRDAFATAVEAKLVTDQGKNMFKVAGQSTDQEKYATFKQGAAEVGVAGWECKSPFEKLYGKQVEQAAAEP